MFMFYFECFSFGKKHMGSNCSWMCFFFAPLNQMDLRILLIITVSGVSSSFSKKWVLMNISLYTKITSRLLKIDVVG